MTTLLTESPPVAPEEQITQSVEVVPVISLTPGQKDVLINLFRLATLANNWDGYGSPPPLRSVINRAEESIVQMQIDDLPESSVVPLAGGGVQLEFRRREKEFQLCFFPEGTAEFLKLADGQALEEGPFVSDSQVRSALLWLLT